MVLAVALFWVLPLPLALQRLVINLLLAGISVGLAAGWGIWWFWGNARLGSQIQRVIPATLRQPVLAPKPQSGEKRCRGSLQLQVSGHDPGGAAT